MLSFVINLRCLFWIRDKNSDYFAARIMVFVVALLCCDEW
jgi:hypothetical protein